MARKYDKKGESIGEAKAPHGFRTMTTVQDIKGKEQQIQYETFGIDADAPGLWIKWVGSVLPTLPAAEQAAQYERWVYGVDLNARQQGKQGGPLDPWVPMSKTEEFHLVDGTVRSKETEEVIPNRTRDLADRVRYINRAIEFATERGENPAKAVIAGRDGLIAAGLARENAGRLEVVGGGGKPPKGQKGSSK